MGATLSKELCGPTREIATKGRVPLMGAQYLIEVYPHVSLLALCEAQERLPYKVSKARDGTVAVRVRRLLREFERILTALQSRIAGINLRLPTPKTGLTLSHLKRFEDALDALVCVWTGIGFLEGRAEAYGDNDAAIWCPRSLKRATSTRKNAV
jgi:predicted RNase H-like nuclease